MPPALIRPQIDGKAARFYEWQGAAMFELGRGGAMADSSHPIEHVYLVSATTPSTCASTPPAATAAA